MPYFFWGTVVVLVSTLIYYIVFFSLVYYWHEKKATLVVVPLLYAFEFFAITFLAMCVAVLIIQYWPEMVSLWNIIYGDNDIGKPF
ncbi:MAG TPA: hypothetical protein VI937_01265 [Negativicutes bacterium]|nr:hypothetical protein [Negativicutes bacterium]